MLSVALGGCGGGEGGDDGRTVIAAFYPLAFAAEEVAPPGTTVRNLTPPGVEPHDFELSGRDVQGVAEADAVLYLGRGFQPALEGAVETTEANGVDLLDGLELLEEPGAHARDEHEPDEEREAGEDADPHVWLDPTLYASIVERIGDELGRQEAARRLSSRLGELDAEFERGLADCERRELVTSHTAFGYLARRYDLEQIGITGISPEAEPTPGELRDLVEEVREHGATTVFFETLLSPRLAETVAREVGAETAVLNPLEGLTEEELEEGADYFSVMRDNLRALRQALGCA
jgi:zinc transport system substrate-binding protein